MRGSGAGAVSILLAAARLPGRVLPARLLAVVELAPEIVDR